MKIKKGKLIQRITALLLSTLLIAEMLQSAAPVTVLAQGMDIASGTDWALDADGHLTISSEEGMSDWKSNGKSMNNSKVKTAEILDGVTDITKAFTSGSLTSVILPSSVTSIGTDAFRNCFDLETVIFAEDAKIESIGTYAFGSCSSLKHIIIPDGVTSIGDNAFSRSGLESVEIPDNVREIKSGAFSYCNNLATITWADNDSITIGDYAFRNSGQLTEISIPSSVTEIPLGMFTGCGVLTKVTIPSSVTSIGDDAFYGCSKLMEVTIKATVPPTVNNGGGVEIFQNCGFVANKTEGIKVPSGSADAYKAVWTEWADYIVEEDSSPGDDKEWVLDDDGKLTIMSDAGMQDWYEGNQDQHEKVKSVEIKDGVTTIPGSSGKSPFSRCSNLTSITLPDSIINIGQYAFYECSSLTDIIIPSKVTYIADYAFYHCSKLQTVAMPDDIMGISQVAFEYCTSLTSITIPSRVIAIEDYAFRNCSSLETVVMQSDTPPTINSEVFINCKFVTENSKGILVPSGTADAYKTAWTDWADYITDGSEPSDEFIASGTDWIIDKDGKLTIVSDTGMQDWFIGNHDLHEKVKSAEIKDGVTTIPGGKGYGPFSECNNLTSITLPDSIISIGSYAFYMCTGLTEITLPDKVDNIEEFAFSGCRSLKSITIPDSMTSLNEYTFSNCTNLKNIVIPDSVTSMKNGALWGCSGLTAITIPDKMESIGRGVFFGCVSLTSITIPKSVTSIEGLAFKRCSGLESVIMLGNTPPALIVTAEEGAESHFDECKFVTENSKGIHVPSGTADAYKTAWTKWANYITDENAPAENEDKVKVEAAEKAVTAALATIQVSNTTTRESLETAVKEALEKAGIDGSVTITIEDFAKTNATADAPGSISAKIKIASGTESVIVPVNKAIDQLPDTPADKVAAVKTAVENAVKKAVETALGETKVTNENAEEVATQITALLPNVIAKALEDAGVSDTEIGIGNVDIKIQPATADSEGSIKITIPVTSKEDAGQSANAEVQITIAKPGETSDPDKDKVDAAKKAVEAALADITVSNATTAESLAEAVKEALKKAGIDDNVTVTVEDFVRTNATADAPGSISANIKIASGTESVIVPVNKAIDQLPDTPADKVAAVKTAVENAVKKAVETALGETKVTNENAEEVATQITALLPNVIAKALEDAGVSDTEIGIGNVDIKIQPATADSEGSIKITIPVTSKEDAGQSANAEVQVTIAKPGETSDPDKDAQEAQKTAEDALKNLTITNETTPEDILAALKEAFGDKATVDGIEEFVKEDATEDAPGSLKLKIKLTINGNTIFIVVNVPIAQLIERTGMYVRFTDYYDMVDSTPRYKYTGMAIKPAVEVYNDQTLLIPGKDYTLGYKNNSKVGSTAALTVKGKGNFSGTSNVINFTIINADINEDTEHPTEMTVTVNTKVAPIIMNGTKKLTTKDYKLEGTGLVNGKYAAATAAGAPNTLTVKGIGSYEGSSFEIKVTVIEKSAAKKLAVTVDKNFKPVYDGQALDFSTLIKSADNGAGVISVTDSKDKTKLLKEGTDFTVVCTSSLSNAGTVKFTVTGMGEYTGSVNKTFKIVPLKVTDSNKFSVTFDENKAYEYKTDGVTVDNLVVRYLGATDTNADDEILTPGVDYKVTYSNNKKVSGTKDAGFKITFLGNYKGSSAISKPFKVVTAKLSSANTVVTVPDKVYKKANQAYKSTPIVTVDGVTIKASNYTVAYAWATESQAGDDTKYVSDNKVKITIADGDTYAKVKVTITMKETGSYGPAEGAVIAGEYYVRKAGEAIDLSKAKVTLFNKAGAQLKTLEYNGKTFYTPAGNNPEANNAPADSNAVYVKVTVKDTVVDPSLYDVTWTNARAKGKATVVIRGKGIASEKGAAVGSKNQAVNIKAMVLKGKTLNSYIWNTAGNLKNLLFQLKK